jgi:hypothetical protein
MGGGLYLLKGVGEEGPTASQTGNFIDFTITQKGLTPRPRAAIVKYKTGDAVAITFFTLSKYAPKPFKNKNINVCEELWTSKDMKSQKRCVVLLSLH